MTKLNDSLFDTLLEGVQVIDFEWNLVFVNNTFCKQVNLSKKELVGQDIRKHFPDFKKTAVFEAMEDCLKHRKVLQLQQEYTFGDKSKKWYQFTIKPVEEGICIFSIDITPFKKREEKAEKISQLYAFISQINQNIVHITEQEALFKNACKIALEFGRFTIAWIGLFDATKEKMSLVAQSGSTTAEINQFMIANLDYSQKKVLKTGKHFICNDIENDIQLANWKPFINKNGIDACLILPLRKGKEIIGTLNLYSSEMPTFDKDEMDLLIEVAKDISYALDRMEKEKQHQRNEEIILFNEKRFRALVENSKDIIALCDKEGTFIYASPNFTKLLGYTVEEYLNLSASSIIHPSSRVEFVKKMKTIVRTPGKSFHTQQLVQSKSGKWIWCEGRLSNMTQIKSVEAIVINFRDSTEKKRTAEKLLKSETFSRNILNSLSAHIAVINKKGKIIAVNDAWTRFTMENNGTSLEKTGLGCNYFKVCKKSSASGDTSAKTVLNGLQNVIRKTENSFYFEYPCHSDEMQRWFAMVAMPFDGNEDFVVIGHQNISQRKLAEEVLVQKNEELEKTNYELDRFVYSVSHDLRSPLTSVLGLLAFIQEDSKEPETLKHTEMIRNSINRLDEFIKNILSYSRNNRMELAIEKVPLEQTTEEIVTSLLHSKEAKNIAFDIEVNEVCPFYSDKQSFSTIIENIVSNAIKFQDKNKEFQFIKINAHSQDDYLKLTITDNGIGIDKENYSKIFDMFMRISGDIAGSRIGLYIVKEIVTKIEGTITVQSKVGEETTFTIQLKNLKPC